MDLNWDRIIRKKQHTVSGLWWFWSLFFSATEGRDVWACCEYLLQNRKPMAQRKNPGKTWNDLSAVCYPSWKSKKHPGLPYKYRPTALPQINGLEPMAGTWDHFHWKTSCLMPDSPVKAWTIYKTTRWEKFASQLLWRAPKNVLVCLMNTIFQVKRQYALVWYSIWMYGCFRK